MSLPPPSPSQADISPVRRTLLAGFLSAYAVSLVPWAAALPVDDGAHGAFAALSALLAGRASLDQAQARRLYDALSADDPGFAAGAQALLALVNQRSIDPMQLQHVLDSEQSPLAPLPRRIASAWFLGIVGDGERARCLAFETALNAAIVADVLSPPSYSYGAYGSWATKPV
ncbi:sugar dehydrogenase complex small subunit [Massilia sp. LXY-6]|uniref:sugar dehydrogenase complex small subunit n=1 Tax=Massilia sp. LXY-6 TaxID=3379823 RepID=UPI003EE1852E